MAEGHRLFGRFEEQGDEDNQFSIVKTRLNYYLM